jgi:hypothetical protein
MRLEIEKCSSLPRCDFVAWLRVLHLSRDIHFHGGGASKLLPKWDKTRRIPYFTASANTTVPMQAAAGEGPLKEPLTLLPHYSHNLNLKGASFDTNL